MGRTVDSHTVKTTMLRINIWILAGLYSHYPFVFLPACPYNLMPETSQSEKVTLYRTPATTINDLVISYQWNFDLVSGIDILYDASSLGAAINPSEHYNCCCIPGTQKQYFQYQKRVTESVNTPL